MIFFIISFFVYSISSAIPSDRVEIVYPSLEINRFGEKRIKFRAFEQDIELRLEPAGDIISDHFTVIDGVDGKHHSIDIENLKRKLYKDKKMGASLHVSEDGPITIKGIVNSKLRIKPHESKLMNKDGIMPHRIIEIMEEENSQFSEGVVPSEILSGLQYTETTLKDGQCLRVEFLFITEPNFTRVVEETDTLTDYLSTMLTGVQLRYDTFELNISVVFLGYIRLTEENVATVAPYIVKSYLPQHPRFLNKKVHDYMADFYCRSKDPLIKKADLVMLMSERPLGIFNEKTGKLSTGTLGVAFTGTACNPCWKYGVTVDDAVLNNRVATVTHESAHILGCVHDGEGPPGNVPGSPGAKNCPARDGYIMAPALGSGKNSMKFSKCSKECLLHSIRVGRAHCMIEEC